MQPSSPLTRIESVIPDLEKIRQLSGAAGVSVGVLHHGKVLYKDNLGHSDIAADKTADSQTLYGIGSLTKSMTVLGVANLVDDGLLSWDTPIKDILPEFQPKDSSVANLTTVVDLLAHRTGVNERLSLAIQGGGEMLLPKEQLMPIFNNLDQISSFRGDWVYNNLGYAIVARIIEKITRHPFKQYLKTHVFDRFGMNRTIVGVSSQHNIAKPYMSYSNATPVELNSDLQFEDSLFEASGSVYSNIDDMLAYSASLLDAYQAGGQSNSIKGLDTILSAHIPLWNPSFRERSYALGWIRTQLPGILGLMGANLQNMGGIKKLPEIGQGSSMLCLYHQGVTLGYQSNIVMFPETKSAIIVLSNSRPLIDLADTIAQALIQALFDFENPVDFVAFAEKSSRNFISHFQDQAKQISERRRPGSQGFPLESYIGNYWNELQNFEMEIRSGSENDHDALDLLFQGRESQRYTLRHLEDNIFEWTVSLDEAAERGRRPIKETYPFFIHFGATRGMVDHLIWEGKRFTKAG